MASLFISYSRKDIDSARKLTEAFKDRELDFWIDWEGIAPTVDWWREIQKGIEEADIFLFLLSPDSCSSKVCQQEIEHAVKNGKRLIPVVVRDVNAGEVPAELGHLNWIFLRAEDDFNAGFAKLIKAINTDYAWVQSHRRLQVKALEWERSNHENSFLLRGTDLQDAETQLVMNSLKEPHPTDLQREYVLKSRQATDRQRRTVTSIAVIGLITLAALAIFAFVQAGLATDQANQRATAQAKAEIEADQRATAQSIAEENQKLAEERAIIALARQLEAQAPNLVNHRTDEALLLSLEANRIAPSEEASNNLLSILESNPRLQTYIHAHPADIQGVAFNLDGSSFATGSIDGTIDLWDSSTGKQIGGFFIGQVNSLIFSSDAQLLAAGYNNGRIDVWSVAAGKVIRSFQHNHTQIRSLAFGPDGHILASGSRDKTIFLWNVDTGEPILSSLQGHTALVGSLAFSPDGKTLAAGDDDSNIILWDTANGQIINDKLQDHNSWIMSLAFSPDGKMLASGSGDNTIILWDLQEFRPISHLLKHTSWVHCVAFSPDGRILASGGQDGLIVLWDMQTRQPIDQPLHGHTGAVFNLAFHPDNETLLSGGGDHTVIKWGIHGFTRIGKVLAQKTTRMHSVAFSPNGKILAVGDVQDGGIALWDLETQKLIEPLLFGHKGRIRSLAFSPNGKLLASAGDDKTVILWDIETHKKLAQLQGHKNQVMSVSFSPDSELIASGSKDTTIIIWNVQTYEPIMHLQGGHAFWVMSVAFRPDGQWLASGGWDRMIWLWDLKTGKGIRLERKNLDLVSSVAFSPDGKQLAASGHPGDISLWNVDQHLPLEAMLVGHQSGVNSIAYNSKKNYLASGSNDGTVILWDLANLQIYAQFPAGHEGVNSVAFSPDGRTLASGSCDQVDSKGLCLEGKIIIWNLDPLSWQALACRMVGRNLSTREWREHFEDLPYHVTCPEWPAGE